MIQLIYSSRATRPFTLRELDELLAISRRNNRRLGVTGMLLHDRGGFLQVLEGNRAVVTRLFEKIARDPRHDDIRMLVTMDIEGRQFGEWSMGFYDGDRDPSSHPVGFKEVFGPEVAMSEISPGTATRLLLSFREGTLHEAVAT